MAEIELTQTHMLIKLSLGEKVFGMHGDFKIPAALIRGAEVADNDVWKTFGMRIPGTALPGLLVYGHYWRANSKAARRAGKKDGGLDLCPLALKPPIVEYHHRNCPGTAVRKNCHNSPRCQGNGRHHQRRDRRLLESRPSDGAV